MNKKLRTSLPAVFAALLIALFATSCNDENKGKVDISDSLTDIVTLESMNDDGFTVTLRKEGDSPLVTLTCAGSKLDPSIVKVGERFLFTYKPESGEAYKSGPVTPLAYRPIINANIIEGTAQSTSSWMTMALDVYSIWRTGEYLNLSAVAQYLNQPKKLELVVDKTTLDQPVPDAYLLFDTDAKVDTESHATYASFNISSVWSLPTVTALRVTVVTNNGTRRFTFSKDTPDVIQPVE